MYSEKSELQKEYINRVSLNLRNFKWLDKTKANCSCPICGDSKKNQVKARGYFLLKENSYIFYCHNCHASISFSNFLKTYNIPLYSQFMLDSITKPTQNRYKSRSTPRFDKPKEKPREQQKINLPSILSLPNNHHAKTYILNRKIPIKYHNDIFFSTKFADFVKEYQSDYTGYNEERIVIPFYDHYGNLIAFQGRSLSGNSLLRYITIKLDEKYPKLYNINNMDKNKKIYIVEGPFDAMFLDNAIAVAGSGIPDNLDKLKANFIYVADREPRNPHIIKTISNMINRKYSVALLPEIQGKDINDYILNGYSPRQVQTLIDNHTFSGLEASFQLKLWKKI